MTQSKYRRMLAISTLSLVMLVGNTLSLPASALAAPTETSQAQTVKPIANLTSKTVMGLDLSEYQQYLTDYQKPYYNFKGDALGTSQALMLFLKNCGVNTISVKVAVDPASNNKKTLSLDSAAKTLAAAKKAGLKTNVVLLYSDEMTYAKTQTLPTKWQQLKPAELLDTAKNYTEKTLMSLKAAAAQPDMVTIGHDVNYNFLGLTGNDTNEWNGYYDMAQLSQVVTKLDSHTQVALGLATPKVNDFQWVLQALGKVQAKYNILGLTVYPTDETNADIAKLRDQFAQVAPDKQLVVSGVKFAKQSNDKTASVAKQTANILSVACQYRKRSECWGDYT
ncbi:MAG: glycosyl hydrolase 53 family protein [Lactobacillus sp.]